MKYYVVAALLAIVGITGAHAQQQHGNPIIPDLIADPSIIEIGDTFYCYATTDGYGHGLATSGPPVVWKSKDFVHWGFTGTLFPPTFNALYWAPSKVIRANGKYYLYPTLNHNITATVASSPNGPFQLASPDAVPPMVTDKGPKGTKGIDAEVFIDDDGKAYMFWAQRGAARLHSDMVTLDTTVVIPTKRGGYSEGPIFFKRNGIYYYLYTLSGHENYQYAYIYSRVSPLGPFEFPKEDIIATTDHAKGIYGPGHGCVFTVKATGKYYLAYLEFGRGGTNRQVWVDKMEFNKDGTIQPVVLTHEGVGALHAVKSKVQPVAIQSATASSTLPDLKIKPIKDSTLNRTETYAPQNAFDGCNGTRWMAAATDSSAWYMVNLGKITAIKQADVYFDMPTAGHAYRLEYSTDGNNWQRCGGHDDVRIQSPHTDTLSIKAQYLRITFLKGAPGIWELNLWK
jgi:beta-xylosidase